MKTINRLRSAVIIFATVTVSACMSKNNQSGGFTVIGDLKNAPDQKIYLEQLHFSQRAPEINDSATMKKGKFRVAGKASEESIFRLRLEKSDAAFLLINDGKEIRISADLSDKTLSGYHIAGRANTNFKGFLTKLDSKVKILNAASPAVADSATVTDTDTREKLIRDYQRFIIHSIDTLSNPVIAMFAVGNSRGLDTASLNPNIYRLPERFPQHQGVKDMVAEYRAFFSRQVETKPKSAAPGIGDTAPDFTMNDAEGRAFSLKDLRGKYVLIDFWASWCGPCRRENPNVVAAYKKYSRNNFTVLGVSLDEDKQKWLRAIEADGLLWKQVSDLQQWNSLVVPLYQFDGIPYNVLIDPQGKIIATALRAKALGDKLAQLF